MAEMDLPQSHFLTVSCSSLGRTSKPLSTKGPGLPRDKGSTLGTPQAFQESLQGKAPAGRVLRQQSLQQASNNKKALLSASESPASRASEQALAPAREEKTTQLKKVPTGHHRL